MSSAQHHVPPTPNRRRRLLAGVVGVAALAAAAAPAFAGNDPPVATAAIQRALDETVAAGAPGAVALVKVGGRTIRLSSGNSNLDPARPIHATQRTRIGGMTKTFTAAVVLQLVGEGKLALSQSLEQWLPGRISNGASITIRQLLNHTSGIYDYAKDPAVLAPYEAGDFAKIFDLNVGVQVANDHGPLFAPGTGLAYSNTNYVLLAMIVEKATGRSISDQFEKRIIKPLRLQRTSYPVDSRIDGAHVHGYILLDGAPPLDVTAFTPTLAGAAGALLSNADDVATFYQALLQGRVVPPALLANMQTIDPVATGGIPDSGILGGGWGLGLLREQFPCGEAWGHDAENPGYMTAAWGSKDGNRQVVVVVNTFGEHGDPVPTAMRSVLTSAYCGR